QPRPERRDCGASCENQKLVPIEKILVSRLKNPEAVGGANFAGQLPWVTEPLVPIVTGTNGDPGAVTQIRGAAPVLVTGDAKYTGPGWFGYALYPRLS